MLCSEVSCHQGNDGQCLLLPFDAGQARHHATQPSVHLSIHPSATTAAAGHRWHGNMSTRCDSNSKTHRCSLPWLQGSVGWDGRHMGPMERLSKRGRGVAVDSQGDGHQTPQPVMINETEITVEDYGVEKTKTEKNGNEKQTNTLHHLSSLVQLTLGNSWVLSYSENSLPTGRKQTQSQKERVEIYNKRKYRRQYKTWVYIIELACSRAGHPSPVNDTNKKRAEKLMTKENNKNK